MLPFLTLTAAADDDDRRLDRILRKALPDMPLSAVHRLLRKGRVLVNGTPGKAADRIRAGSVIQIRDEKANANPQAPGRETKSGESLPDLDILWEGPEFLALNKPAGLAAHGPESLETRVQVYLADKLPPSLSFKPGPLHRLDKPTSGIILFSKSLEGARYFSGLFQERNIRKQYLALLEGVLERDETWEDVLIRDRESRKSFTAPEAAGNAGPETGRIARTRSFPLAAKGGYTLVILELDTGRTHQIRAQAAARGHPLAGDRKYGGRPEQVGLLLHAWKLELPEEAEPLAGQKALPEMPHHLEAPLPENFRRRIRELFGEGVLDSIGCNTKK
ncbi:RluA family pseudouridine synthase [Treponema primitia]|nr:RluA family pseudouridine synthase [Treponema primitia]